MEVLSRLAEAFSRQERMKKTHLHFASRVNWVSFARYLNWLQVNNMVESRIENKNEEYQLTDNGKQMCNLIMKLKEHIKSAKSIFAILMLVFLHDSLRNAMDILT